MFSLKLALNLNNYYIKYIIFLFYIFFLLISNETHLYVMLITNLLFNYSKV